MQMNFLFLSIDIQQISAKQSQIKMGKTYDRIMIITQVKIGRVYHEMHWILVCMENRYLSSCILVILK
jgi:hypothetical protein